MLSLPHVGLLLIEHPSWELTASASSACRAYDQMVQIAVIGGAWLHSHIVCRCCTLLSAFLCVSLASPLPLIIHPAPLMTAYYKTHGLVAWLLGPRGVFDTHTIWSAEAAAADRTGAS